MEYSLGSLFDGSGGFPLAGSLCGIEPKWAAEVEPYPIAVTRSRFPNMRHLGDISKVNGAEIEPVDIITFGSPCQDLSVAGKRAGLKHEANGDEETTRSGLFMEAVRIIKEMRDATNGEYPTFALWENVPGAFSSNKGEDFRIVLEELIKIIEPTATMPAVPKNGWPYADSYIGDGWSLAYRVFDAQYWGVPQRRRRIHLIVDFRGERAREVLFEREGVRGYFEKGRTPWQGLAGTTQDCIGADDCRGSFITLELGIAAREGGHIYEGVCGTLRAKAGDNQMAVAYSIENHPADSRVNIDETGKVQTLTSRMGTGGGNVPMIMEPWVVNAAGFKPSQGAKAMGVGYEMEKAPTLLAGQEPGVVYCLQGNVIDRADTAGCNGKGWKEDTSYTLNTIDRPAVVYALDRVSFNQGANAKYDFDITDSGVNSTLVARGPSAVAYLASGKEAVGTLMASASTKLWLGNQEAFSGDYHIIEGTDVQYIVRRLTPTECARLQGFADRWGDIEEKDCFTDEEFQFWHDVRNTHAIINDKKVQEYTEKQMLAWYNKLHTDSAEYKMWGNGIALPPALYCMQGIKDALDGKYDVKQNVKFEEERQLTIFDFPEWLP